MLEKKSAANQLSSAENDQNNKKAQTEKTGVLQAFKLMFKVRQLRFNALACFLFALFAGVVGYLSSILVTSGLTTEQFTQAMLFFPIFNALITFLSGFLADAIGRKKAALLMLSSCLFALLLLIYGAGAGFAPAVLGTLVGIFTGLLWSVSDLLTAVLPTESTPTNIRASVLGNMSFTFSIGYIVSTLVIATLITFISSIGLVCAIVGIVFLPPALFIIGFKIKETKGADLEKITTDI